MVDFTFQFSAVNSSRAHKRVFIHDILHVEYSNRESIITVMTLVRMNIIYVKNTLRESFNNITLLCV